MLRVVIDAGVFISALLSPTGAPAEILKHWMAGSFELIVCPHLIDEIEMVLGRPKFRSHLSEEEAGHFVAIIKTLTIPKKDPNEIPAICTDPKDDYLFALARENGASFIVSGDEQVLGVDNFPVPSVRPRDFLLRLSID